MIGIYQGKEMETIVRIFLFIGDTVSKLWSPLKPVNPSTLQREFYQKHKMRLRSLERQVIEMSSKNLVLSVLNLKLLNTAKRYGFRANLAWGKSIEQRYKSAWFNVIAGELYSLANAFDSAGSYYHYAARVFNEVGEYELAGKYYHESALCFKKVGEVAQAIQSLKRGVATYHLVEGKEEADKLKSLIDEWETVKHV